MCASAAAFKLTGMCENVCTRSTDWVRAADIYAMVTLAAVRAGRTTYQRLTLPTSNALAPHSNCSRRRSLGHNRIISCYLPKGWPPCAEVCILSTARCFLCCQAFEQPGTGRVLVVDGGGSKRCALLGDNIAEMAHKNGWSGVVIYGCIRDSEDIGKMPLGVKALGTYPLKSAKRDVGLADVPVTIAGVTVEPGDWLYADKDGILVSKEELKL
eukprot:GHRQ01012535.1.p1 GENE.GHRQ01012535.1~~GHRQ01012535.1.p1  ORF type:complete len:213 (+),score=42.14 GHRQ01012535.1:410-1048(+)